MKDTIITDSIIYIGADDKDIDLFDINHVEEDSKVQDEINKTGVLIYEE